jgi:hypothetical protein
VVLDGSTLVEQLVPPVPEPSSSTDESSKPVVEALASQSKLLLLGFGLLIFSTAAVLGRSRR